jgi:hypothetical protein
MKGTDLELRPAAERASFGTTEMNDPRRNIFRGALLSNGAEHLTSVLPHLRMLPGRGRYGGI